MKTKKGEKKNSRRKKKKAGVLRRARAPTKKSGLIEKGNLATKRKKKGSERAGENHPNKKSHPAPFKGRTKGVPYFKSREKGGKIFVPRGVENLP